MRPPMSGTLAQVRAASATARAASDWCSSSRCCPRDGLPDTMSRVRFMSRVRVRPESLHAGAATGAADSAAAAVPARALDGPSRASMCVYWGGQHGEGGFSVYAKRMRVSGSVHGKRSTSAGARARALQSSSPPPSTPSSGRPSSSSPPPPAAASGPSSKRSMSRTASPHAPSAARRRPPHAE